MPISNCINLIKMSLKNNKKGFIIDNNNKNVSVVKSFLKINIIKFVVLKNDKLIIFVNYKDSKPAFKNIINMYKPGNKLYISYKNLLKITKKHNWVFILSTSKGIINSVEALRLRVGGLIVAKLWN